MEVRGERHRDKELEGRREGRDGLGDSLWSLKQNHKLFIKPQPAGRILSPNPTS